MSVVLGDCLDVMAGMEPESVDAIVTDPPYGIGFMGKAWDSLSADAVEASWDTRGRNTDVDVSPKSGGGDWGRSGVSYAPPNPRCGKCGRTINGRDTAKGFKVCHCHEPTYAPTPNRSAQRSQAWHTQWAEAAYRLAKPSAYLLAFGGTRTVHRMTCALEDAGWIIRDMLVWGYASGFPKSKASLKPAWEPIVMARKPGPLRMLAIDECRIEYAGEADYAATVAGQSGPRSWKRVKTASTSIDLPPTGSISAVRSGRWPANIVLTDPIFDGGIEGVVGGGEAAGGTNISVRRQLAPSLAFGNWHDEYEETGYGDTGTYSRFFLVPKAARSDREPVLPGLSQSVSPRIESAHSTVCATCGRQRVNVPGAACSCANPEWVRKPQTARANVHPTVKPVDLMRHLVRLVTPTGGTVLDPFLGSGTTALAAEMEGFPWIGIEREAEYVAIAEARLNGVQRGLGLEAS